MRTIGREAYGEDIGQHSWVSADELRADMQRLKLCSSSRCLDLGCGPCGPLSFIVSTVWELGSSGARGSGARGSVLSVDVGRAGTVKAEAMSYDRVRTSHTTCLTKRSTC